MANKYDIKDYLKSMRDSADNDHEAATLQSYIDALDELEKPRDTTYNSYPNYETWSVALLIDNDEWSAEEAQSMARQASGAYSLAGELREWVKGWEDISAALEGSGLASQLLGAVLSSDANWDYLGKSYYDEAQENAAYEPEEEERRIAKRHPGTYHVAKTPTDTENAKAETAFIGTWTECLDWMAKHAEDAMRDPDDVRTEFRDDECVVINGDWFDLESGFPEIEEELLEDSGFDVEDIESDDEPPVRDMDDAGN